MGLNILAWAKAKKYTDNAVSQTAGLHREIVNSLPITGDEKVIYMVPVTGSGDDNYNEYMWINGAYELIGNTRVDLTDYYNKTQVDAALSAKANTADTYTKTEVDTALSGKANTSDIPTTLAGLSDDATHRLVTDTEKTSWDGKASAATSLAGYGITDAYTKNEVDTALGNCIVAQNNAGFHNSIYRGKSLGSSVTAAQQTAIHNGTFEDLFIGDYWTINNVNYRIAAFDYWLGCGTNACTSHHVLLVPDGALYTAKMNTSSSTEGGYAGSAMRGGVTVPLVAAGNLSNAKTTIKSAFGASAILTHYEYLTNAVSSGYPSHIEWYLSDVELMSEPMVYGSYVFTPGSTGSVTPTRDTVSIKQLPLFRLNPSAIVDVSISWWLRDVVTAKNFAMVSITGAASNTYATSNMGVRPCFAITY